MTTVEDLKDIYKVVKKIVELGDFHYLDLYIRSFLKDADNHEMRTILVATKAFKERDEVKESIAEVTKILENRVGHKIV